MKKISKLLICTLMVISGLLVSCIELPDTGEFLPELEDAVFAEINQVRINNGYQTLDWNTELHEFSRDHSQDMGDNDYYSSTTPDGEELWDRFAESGITATAVGECIWMQDGDVAEIDEGEMAHQIVDDWLVVVADYTIVLEEDYNQGSVGCYRINDKLYVTFNGIEK